MKVLQFKTKKKVVVEGSGKRSCVWLKTAKGSHENLSAYTKEQEGLGSFKNRAEATKAAKLYAEEHGHEFVEKCQNCGQSLFRSKCGPFRCAGKKEDVDPDSIQIDFQIHYQRRMKTRCNHKGITIKEDERCVECRACGEKVDPYEYLRLWAIEGWRLTEDIKDLTRKRDALRKQVAKLKRQAR